MFKYELSKSSEDSYDKIFLVTLMLKKTYSKFPVCLLTLTIYDNSISFDSVLAIIASNSAPSSFSFKSNS